ncbi:MAG TPA: lysozyme [Acidobacteriaceae bacterium]|jgi:lysozyme|nr:lysozyme [Acidobacteriaceae bacterium]
MGVNQFTYSGKGLALTEQFEGCRLTAYQDQVGVWTIGYGHTGPEVGAGMIVTLEQAEALLAKDVSNAAEFVNRVVMVETSQEEFDALVDFVFNLGAGAFERSTLLRVLNAGNFAAAATQFALWDRAGGAVVAGLLRRRQAETALFTEGQAGTESA